MTKFSCNACKLEAHRIKTLVLHTCAKADKKYKEPDMITDATGNLYKIYYHKKLYGSQSGMKYSIVRNQYLNGYKVPAGSTLWLLHSEFHEGNEALAHPFIWVKERTYRTLAFV